MKITKKQAKKIGDYFHLNFDIVNLDEWCDGLNIELEHGTKFGLITNVTNDNIKLTAKIAIAHLLEDPKYYYYLKQMEDRREKYWDKKKKPFIFKTN